MWLRISSRPLLLLVLLLPWLTACSTMEEFWDKEVLGAYMPEKLRQKQTEEGRRFLVESLNYYLARSKDDRVRVFGPPVQCTALGPVGETCLWRTPTQQVAFAYDGDGYARSWAYEGPQGQFTSQAYPPPPRNVAVTRPPEAEWTHPQKPGEAFSQDYNRCRLELPPRQQDSGTLAAGNGAAPLMDREVERCVKEKGWVEGTR